MAETWHLRELANWRGKDLVSIDGIKLGDIREIIYDYLSGEPVWLGIGSAKQPKFRTLLVPAQRATVEGDHLRSAFTKQKIEGEPHADFGEGFDSLTEEHHLYDYFGIPLDGERELRVLREGGDFPGLETVTTE